MANQSLVTASARALIVCSHLAQSRSVCSLRTDDKVGSALGTACLQLLSKQRVETLRALLFVAATALGRLGWIIAIAGRLRVARCAHQTQKTKKKKKAA